MKVLVIVGMPASGKNIARLYAEPRGIPYFATGDLVRAEAKRRGLAGPEQTAALSTELRGEDGMGVTKLALTAALQSGKPLVFLEGMRSWPEIELIRSRIETVVIAFVAPRETRRRRVAERGRDDDSAAAFDDRDRREILYGASIPVALADHYILNTGTIEEAFERLDRIVKTCVT
ncbi:MAG TPA: AAA family ATPase [Syntrophales bacterium]|nr:AAA family ATPase [Syntrophales bacterium]HRT62090.1 AAA family ATPase [Syntrophales bacterium]